MEQELATDTTAETAEKQQSPEAAAVENHEPSAEAPEGAEQQAATGAAEKPPQRVPPQLPPSAPAEVWANNERMRHVPSSAWIADKVDGDVRRRLDILTAALEAIPSADPRHAPIEQGLRSVCNALDLLAHTARHSRASTPPNELANRVGWSLNNAVSSVRAIDPNSFGRRYPFHTFERSKAESVYAALVIVLDRLERVVPLLRDFDPSLDERLLQGLVNLQTPMRPEKIA